MSTITKACVACGTDVSQHKRVKDDRGRYYCDSCWTASRHPERHVSPPKAITAQQQTAEKPTCDNCGRAIGKLEQVCTWKDHLVCGACFQLLQTEALPLTPPIRNGGIANDPHNETMVADLKAEATSPVQLPSRQNAAFADNRKFWISFASISAVFFIVGALAAQAKWEGHSWDFGVYVAITIVVVGVVIAFIAAGVTSGAIADALDRKGLGQHNAITHPDARKRSNRAVMLALATALLLIIAGTLAVLWLRSVTSEWSDWLHQGIGWGAAVLFVISVFRV